MASSRRPSTIEDVARQAIERVTGKRSKQENPICAAFEQERHAVAERAIARIVKAQRRFDPARKIDVTKKDWIALRATHLRDTNILEPFQPFYQQHPLLEATLKRSTHVAYQQGLDFLQDHAFVGFVTFAQLDACIETEATRAFSSYPSAGTRQKIVNSIAALCPRCPQLRERLPLARRALAGWNKLLDPQQAAPVTRAMLLAFSGCLLEKGHLEEAICIVVAWSALLRMNEATNLKVQHVALPGDPRLAQCPTVTAAVLVESAKTGPRQLAIIDDPIAVQALVSHVERKQQQNDDQLFNTRTTISSP